MHRRSFLKLSATLAAGSALGHPAFTPRAGTAEAVDPAPASAPKPLRLLILGGTGFTGPHQVRYALARGHQVTVFNRGKTRPGELPKEAEQLLGDRNGKLDALRGRQWDVVVDNPATLPVWVRDAAKMLQDNVGRYVFISTISVYADGSRPDQDETAPLAKYEGADAMAETRESLLASQFALYGPLKARAEQEAERWFPGRTLVIRPGLIVGPGDETDRFTYWPVRLARGGETLAPGDPADPVQFIDARDLAEWTIRMVEAGETGTFNATGPAATLGVGAMLEGIRAGIAADDARLTWVPADFLETQKIAPWTDLPVWVPPRGDMGGLGRTSIRRALGKGLTFRPLADTARDTLSWFRAQSAERQGTLRAGLTAERETAALLAWREKNRSQG